MIFELIGLTDELRKGYGEFQDRSIMGQSPMDRQSRRLVNWICWSLIALIVIGNHLGMYCRKVIKWNFSVAAWRLGTSLPVTAVYDFFGSWPEPI